MVGSRPQSWLKLLESAFTLLGTVKVAIRCQESATSTRVGWLDWASLQNQAQPCQLTRLGKSQRKTTINNYYSKWNLCKGSPGKVPFANHGYVHQLYLKYTKRGLLEEQQRQTTYVSAAGKNTKALESIIGSAVSSKILFQSHTCFLRR